MKQLLRLFAVAALWTVLMLTTAAAAPPPPGERAEAFAVCAGRLWALSVRQAAVGNPDWRNTGALRNDFDMLLEAVRPATMTDREARLWRSDGWVQIAHLLARHQYGKSSRRRSIAAARMASRIDSCRGMILDR
ncbi:MULTISPECIES: hypothetical protein [unclassified Marinovum]